MNKRMLLTAVAAALLIIAAGALWFFLGQQPQIPAAVETETGYVPPPRDALAVDAADFAADLPTLSTTAYSVALNPDMRVDAQGNCSIWLKNPQENPCYLMLDVRLADSGLLIYRTGLLAPGEGIPAIQFVPEALEAMAQGDQTVELTVYSFHLDDYTNLGDARINTQLSYEIAQAGMV